MRKTIKKRSEGVLIGFLSTGTSELQSGHLLHFLDTITTSNSNKMRGEKNKTGEASSNHLRPTPTPPFLCRKNRSCHLEPPNTVHMWVQPWQSDCIVEQAVEFIRKKLARRSAGFSPIGQSRGPLRLRAPQTFLRIIFSIPLLSSVRTDQIIAQGLHCEGPFRKSCFQCLHSFMLSLSLTSYTTIPKM